MEASDFHSKVPTTFVYTGDTSRPQLQHQNLQESTRSNEMQETTHHTLHLKCKHKSKVHIATPSPTRSSSAASKNFNTREESEEPVESSSIALPTFGFSSSKYDKHSSLPNSRSNSWLSAEKAGARHLSEPDLINAVPYNKELSQKSQQKEDTYAVQEVCDFQRLSRDTYEKVDGWCPRCAWERKQQGVEEEQERCKLSSIMIVCDMLPPENIRKGNDLTGKLKEELWVVGEYLLQHYLLALFVGLLVIFYSCGLIERLSHTFKRVLEEITVTAFLDSLWNVVWRGLLTGGCLWGFAYGIVRVSLKTRRNRRWWLWV